MIFPTELVQLLALVVAPSGAAWAGVRLALNGTNKKIQAVAEKVDRVDAKVDRTREEVAFLRGRFAPVPWPPAAGPGWVTGDDLSQPVNS